MKIYFDIMKKKVDVMKKKVDIMKVCFIEYKFTLIE